MKRNGIQIILYPGDESGYVAGCVNLPAITQGLTVDEPVKNRQKALALHLEGETGIGNQAQLHGAKIIAHFKNLFFDASLNSIFPDL